MRTFTPSKAELSPSFPVEEQRHHVVCWPELFPLRAARAARCQGPKPRTALNPRTAHGAPSTHNPGAETKHTPRPLALQTCPRHLLGLLGVVPWPWARRELSPCSWTPQHITNPGRARGTRWPRQMLSLLLLHPSSGGKGTERAGWGEEGMAQLGTKHEGVSRGTRQRVSLQSKGATREQPGREKHPGHLLAREGTGVAKPGRRRPKERSGDEGGEKRAELPLSTALAPTEQILSLDIILLLPPAASCTGERCRAGQGEAPLPLTGRVSSFGNVLGTALFCRVATNPTFL